MIEKFLAVLLVSFFAWSTNAQNKLLTPQIDSIDLNYRSSGYEIDSVDIVLGAHENLRPSGFRLPELYLSEYLKQGDVLGNSFSGFSYLQRNISTPNLVSSLPYLGFQYSFGSSNTQNLNLQYSQQINDKTLFNLRYNKKSSNGFLRLGAYALNDVNAVILRKAKFYSSKFDFNYSNYTWNESGGITTDTLLDSIIAIITPVYKTDAETKVKRADIRWSNYLNFSKDSILKTGVFQESRYELVNREYRENSPYLNLDTFFIDSNSTRDQYQTASIKNGIGYFFSSKFFEINASANHRYWRNQNLNRYFDTTEIFLASELYAGFEKFNLSNSFYFNLIGATGEIKNYTKLNVDFPWFNLKANLDFLNVYPTPYQREHYANNYQWKLNDLSAQQIINLGGEASLKTKINLGSGVNFNTINNGLFLIDGQWRQDTLNTISTGNIELFANYNLWKFGFHHVVDLNINSNNYAFQPTFTSGNRINFRTSIFKAKKLKLNLGIDLSYIGPYNNFLYIPELSTYSISTKNTSSGGDFFLLHAFAAIDIDPFRIYIRAENVSNLWNSAKIRVDANYPIMPLYLKMGLSWDFFN